MSFVWLFIIACLISTGNTHGGQEEEESPVDIPDIVFPLFEKISRLFVTVSLSQFRKDYLRVTKREKTKALRKKITEKKASKENCPCIQDVYKDTSSDKTVTHLKLKTSALEHEDFYKRLTKSEIIMLLNAYGVNATMKSKKQELGEALHEHRCGAQHAYKQCSSSNNNNNNNKNYNNNCNENN